MSKRVTTLVLFGAIGALASACATKGFVREQVGTTETRLSQRVDTQETRLQETADRTAANAQGLDAAGQAIRGLDTRVTEAGTLAGEAKKDAAAAAQAQRDADALMTQRFASRNRYAVVETRVVYFDFNRAELRDEGINELEDIARALKADPNAALELLGFADPRGTDRYNYQLTRERVDAVVRYLVHRHGIDLRRLHTVGMGKAAPPAGEKPTRDTLARSRRVELRLVAPQS